LSNEGRIGEAVSSFDLGKSGTAASVPSTAGREISSYWAIPGYGEGVAADTGSAVQGMTIDQWFPTLADALAWGRRTVTITLH
jgi:3D (Asp-Asp-Asp) domain-containing protein